MNENTLKNLNNLTRILGADRLLTPEDVTAIKEVIVSILANNKKEIEGLTEEAREVINGVLNKIKDEHDTYLKNTEKMAQEVKSDSTDAINKAKEAMKEFEAVKALCKEVMENKPKDGEDADEEKIVADVLAQIKLPEYKEVMLDDGGQIVDKINALPVNEENQIDASHIKNLPKVKSVGGGITQKRVMQLIQESGSAGVTLKVNGTNNVDQGTLDLIEGSGMTITDNGDGTVTFESSGGSGTPGGSNTQLQYNNAGSFGGISGATTDGTATTYTTGNLKAADVKASGSGGLQTLSNNGTVTALFGAGGGANNTFYGDIKANYATASTVPYFDSSKNLVSSAVTPTELGYVSGVTSLIQTQLDGKVDENVAITGATKTKITYDTKGLVTAGADATTADIADSTNKRYVTDAQLTVIGNTSGTNTGDVSVTDSSEIDFTLTGQNITASLKSGSIDETKLDTSVNASLDLADTSVQPNSSPTLATITTTGNIELGNASDTTLSRSAAGQLAVEGVQVATISNAVALSNKTIAYSTEPATDDTAYGETMGGILAGDTLAQWDLVYLDSTSGRWEKADADAIGTAGNVLLGLAMAAGTDGGSLTVLLKGIVRNDGWTWSGAGKVLYASTTAAAMSETAVSGEDDVVRVLGHTLSDDCVFFNPSVNWIIYKA